MNRFRNECLLNYIKFDGISKLKQSNYMKFVKQDQFLSLKVTNIRFGL